MPYDNDDNLKPALLRDELRLIPGWSYSLAVVAFLFGQYFVHSLMPHHHPSGSTGPIGMRIFWGISWGAVLAVYALLIGYISRDAKRRNMNAGLWCLAAIFMPGAIGTVVYFLLRQPLYTNCPACRSAIEAGQNFCAQCRFQVGLVCGQCFRSIRPTEMYCGRCGHNLTEDAVPARLRAMQE
jgi:MFS family permease